MKISDLEEPFVHQLTIPYRKGEVVLLISARNGYYDVTSYWDEHRQDRAWQGRYDNRIFNSAEEILRFYKQMKKKAIKDIDLTV